MDKGLTASFTLPIRKIGYTLLAILIYKIGNALPIVNLDSEAFQKSLSQLENKNMLMQYINLYSGVKNTNLTFFSLGIIPFINASIVFDLLVTIFPSLEKIQSEEGELGRRKFLFYKKILTTLLALVQGYSLIFYFKPYFYDTELNTLALTLVLLLGGSLTIVWLCNFIDNKGIGNGTSILILTNIFLNFLTKTEGKDFLPISTLLIFLLLFFLICLSQTSRISIDIVSARQLAFLEQKEDDRNKFLAKKSSLTLRLNQAGIFPIIIASNLLPFFSFFAQLKVILPILYYLLIIGCSYLYTSIFWDPEKIATELRKASVSIVSIRPGKETVSYLQKVVLASSLLGGLFLCGILILYDFLSKNFASLSQVNITSLIIAVGILYEIQKNLQALYKNSIESLNI
jgi:preprotein translocase subunit SecY